MRIEADDMRWAVVWAALYGCLSVGTAACDGRDDGAVEAGVDLGATDRDVGADASQQPEAAYGLPLPPDVGRIERTETMVEVETSLNIEQLASYYDRKLKNYELFRLGDGTLEVVGLRSFMPAIRAHQVGPLTTVTYVPSREPPEAVPPPDAGGGGAGPGTAAVESNQRPTESRILLGPGAGGGVNTQSERKPGTPVDIRTDEGELLAPGAKWGEPYTPPPGSPLHQPRFESNYGLPFGEWHMD